MTELKQEDEYEKMSPAELKNKRTAGKASITKLIKAIRSTIELQKTVEDIQLLKTNLNDKLNTCTTIHCLHMDKGMLTDEKNEEEEDWLVDLEIEVLPVTEGIIMYIQGTSNTAWSSSPESAVDGTDKRILKGDHYLTPSEHLNNELEKQILEFKTQSAQLTSRLTPAVSIEPREGTRSRVSNRSPPTFTR